VCLHEILEGIDFTATDPSDWDVRIEERLVRHGFDVRWKGAISEMLGRVIQAPLDMGLGKPFALSQIETRNRLNELEFHLPLRAVDATSLGRTFAACRQPAFRGRLPQLMEQLEFSLAGGYLKGFIDLVFRIDNRYYIADWKSNHLGDTFDAYHPECLAEVMAMDYYFLQYHIYALALDRYLKIFDRGYACEKNFGGVFYFFIRGMGSPSRPSSGVFFDRPDVALMQKLHSELLI
jgi:exodeoxyribonuclease V beta subunit